MADGRDASHATFVRPDLGSFCRLDELGLQVVGQRLEPGRVVLACRVVETDEFARWCRRCGCEAAPRDSVSRRLAHEPLDPERNDAQQERRHGPRAGREVRAGGRPAQRRRPPALVTAPSEADETCSAYLAKTPVS